MSKKRIALLLLLIFIASIALTACGNKPQEPAKPNEPAAPAQKLQLTIITGSTGGTYFALGGAMANTFTEQLTNAAVTSQPGGASVESINRVNAGEVDLGMAMNNIADDAWNGKGSFKEKQQNFRTIGVIYPEVYQGVALKSAGITSLEQIKGAKVAVGPVGSGTAVLSEAVFAEAGIDINKDIKGEFAAFGDAANKMKDLQLDANFGVLACPAAAIQDIMTSREIEIIEIKGALFDKIKAKYPFFSQYTIPAGTYGNTEPKLTINCMAALYVTPDVPEDVVYEITKAWYEKTADVAIAHSAAQWLADELKAGKLETAIAGITTPLHKGAYKYFVEKGLSVPDSIKPID
ncbi:MAG: TAXI family TRAP transporter solute-binding subunit [Clostridia bacterium]|nr:TAXI family TRAP transporter solute-binding subunit [Clostridia bacterium]